MPQRGTLGPAAGPHTGCGSVIWGFAAVFFGGYMAGILSGRLTQPAFGTAMAAYYMDGQNYAAFGPVFAGLFAGAFLQATWVLLSAFSAFGTAFLGAFFAARGALLGLCAASVYLAGGSRGLVVHWLLSCLPDLTVFLVMLWLSGYAAGVSGGMLRCVFGGSHISQTPAAKRLVIRYLAALLVCCIVCAAGAGLSIVFAGVLL